MPNPEELDELRFLSDVALRFAEEMTTEDDVFRLVAERIAAVEPSSIIIVCKFVPTIDSTVVHTCVGPPDMMERARVMLGRELVGLTLPMNEGARGGLSDGTLVQINGGVRQLVFETWSTREASRMEEAVGIRGVHAQAFARKGDFLGTASVLSREPEIAHTRLIEALVRLAAVAIQRLRLEARVRESEQQLRILAETRKQAEEALVEADHRKDEFLAVLSHELRNPLSPIRNAVHVLERTDSSTEQAKRARTIIERQVGHLSRLVDDLLDVTRISRGKIQLKKQPLELNQLVRATVEDHRSLFVAAKIELGMTVARDELWIDADATRIAQVIGNVLTNAAKFTPAGGRTSVDVDSDPANGQAILRVKDTGVGIDRSLLPRLFEPFMQADTTIDRSKGGLGLGLMLAKGLIDLHGGSVIVESEGPGKGTQITVRLPMRGATARVGAKGAPPSGGRVRVLVVEDNVDAAETLRDALELEDNSVAVAYSGPEGIEQAREFKPDVVLCDIGLPGMDGYAVARAIRDLPELENVGLVALTGYASPDDVVKSQSAGFDRHIAKPPTIERITDVIADLVRTANDRAGVTKGAPHRI